MWAYRVLEYGPQGARDGALTFISKCNRMISSLREDREIFACIPDWDKAKHEREEVSHFLDLAAFNMEYFFVDNLIQAPPSLHRRLMRREGYRSRAHLMRAF